MSHWTDDQKLYLRAMRQQAADNTDVATQTVIHEIAELTVKNARLHAEIEGLQYSLKMARDATNYWASEAADLRNRLNQIGKPAFWRRVFSGGAR